MYDSDFNDASSDLVGNVDQQEREEDIEQTESTEVDGEWGR